MPEELSVLLEFEVQANNINLRLDTLGLHHFEISNQNIREITLKDCQITEKLVDKMRECIDEIFEYEFTVEDDKKIFQFWGDYGVDDNEIIFQSFEETFSEYTKDDLIRKGKIISQLYIDVCGKLQKNHLINYSLINKLKFELSNDIEKTKRKAEFFENKGSSKSEVLHAQERTLQKLLDMLNEPYKG